MLTYSNLTIPSPSTPGSKAMPTSRTSTTACWRAREVIHPRWPKGGLGWRWVTHDSKIWRKPFGLNWLNTWLGWATTRPQHVALTHWQFWWELVDSSTGFCKPVDRGWLSDETTYRILQGTVLSELIVKFFHGDFTPQGFKRYSGLWKGPPPGNIGKKAWGDETEVSGKICFWWICKAFEHLNSLMCWSSWCLKPRRTISYFYIFLSYLESGTRLRLPLRCANAISRIFFLFWVLCAGHCRGCCKVEGADGQPNAFWYAGV